MAMRDYSLLEAVEVAVNMEEEGIRFYTLASERTGDPEMRKLFAFLLEKEHQHLAGFRRLYAELAAKEGDPDAELWLLDPEVGAYFRAVVESSVFPVKGAAERAIAGLHGVGEILRFALRIEKDSVHFYRELLAHAPWPAAKELVESVIGQERQHFCFIHQSIKDLRV